MHTQVLFFRGLHRQAEEAGRALLLTLAPQSCVGCGRPGLEEPLCAVCRAGVQAVPLCRHCASETTQFGADVCATCRGRKVGFDRIIALGKYDGTLRHMCLSIKSREGAWLVKWLVRLLLEARGDQLRATGASAVVPVPAHWSRRWRRGYDQAEAIADELAKGLGLPCTRLLVRARPTPRLQQLSRARRRLELRGAFRPRLERVSCPRSILLVDDILTTGATCRAAVATLRKMGMRQVSAVVLARAAKLHP